MSPDDICHVCVTHSPLVSRVFAATASTLALPRDKIRFISRRSASIPEPGICLDGISDEMDRAFKKFDRSGYHLARKKFEHELLALTGGQPFEAYIPHVNKILYQEIIGHRDCIAYSFLEEGFTSMAWDTWRNERSNLSKILRSAIRCMWIRPNYRFTRPMFDNSRPQYRSAFTISDTAFRSMPGRTSVSAGLPPLPPGRPPVSTYVILDSAYIHLGVRWEDYESAVVGSVMSHSQPASELRMKFHPADTDAHRRFDSIRRRLARHGYCQTHLLAPDFQIEENLTRNDLLLFGITSLGYYAAIDGVRLVCYADDIKGISMASLIGKGKLPKDFREVVGLPPL